MIKKILAVLILFLSLLSLFGCSKKEEIVKFQTFHTADQASYLALDYKLFSAYANGKEEKSRPNAIKLLWDDNDSVSDYNVVINKAGSNQMLNFTTDKKYVEIYNLEINTKYNYEITKVVDGKMVVVEKKTFIIEDTVIRNLFIDGVTNVRDLGGYKTISGKIVKQGLLYRSGRFNENESTVNLITEKGKKAFAHDLGIKTEIDLRRIDNNETGGITSSPLGQNVNYKSIPMETGGNYLKINKKNIPLVFKELANKDNYPLVFHCSIGTDRTGVIAFLVNGFLGVSEEDLYRDYLFSNFGEIGGMRSPSTIKNYLQEINLQPGNTLQERFEKYLLSLNVSAADLDCIKNIMLV